MADVPTPDGNHAGDACPARPIGVRHFYNHVSYHLGFPVVRCVYCWQIEPGNPNLTTGLSNSSKPLPRVKP